MPTQAELEAAIAAAAAHRQTAEQAALLNAAYRSNQLPILPAVSQTESAYSRAAMEDAYNEYVKHQIAFSQPRGPSFEVGTPTYSSAAAIEAQYAASRNQIVTSNRVYAAHGEIELSDPSGYVGFSGRAAQYRAAFEREVYGWGAPDPEQEYYRRQAEQVVIERPGYTAPADLGDVTTQRVRQSFSLFSQMMNLQNVPVATDYQMTGKFLEAQRQGAYQTPERRDERFFMGELQKWAEIPVEKASAYHDIGMKSGERVPANPYEYQADLAVEFLKGKPQKSSEYFSPVSGEMSRHLPGGVGVQQFAWNEAITDYKRQYVDARTPYPDQISFMDAVAYLGAAEGKYGPYGKLYGGIDTGYVDSAGGRLRGGGMVASQGTITNISGAPTPPVKERNFFERMDFMNALQTGFRTGLSFGGLNPAGGMLVDTAFAMARRKTEDMPFYGFSKSIIEATTPYTQPAGTVTSEQYKARLSDYEKNLETYNIERTTYEKGGFSDVVLFEDLQSKYTYLQSEQSKLEKQRGSIVEKPTILDKAFGVYESLNKNLAPYTTDILGIGRKVEKVQISGEGAVPEAMRLGKGFVSTVYQSPVDIAIGYGVGEVYTGAKTGLVRVVAGAAESKLPVIAKGGRALITPTALDFAGIAEKGVGALFIGSSVLGIAEQPTSEKKGMAAGKFSTQLIGFAAGAVQPSIIKPSESPLIGKEYFSGEMNMGPVERFSYNIRTELLARSQPTEAQATIIRTAAQLGGSKARFQQAPIKGEPVFEEATALGKDYGALIKGVAESKTNPAITKGSMVVAKQYPESTVIEAGIRQAKDWDALVYDVGGKYKEISIASKELPASKQFATAKDVIDADIADIRPIPPKYPGFEPSIAPDVRPSEVTPVSWVERIIGNPFEKIAGPRGTSEQLLAGRTEGYKGTTNAEAAQAQFGRKVGSALKDFAQDPIGQGYRGQKDIYDTISGYQAQKITARKAGVDVTKDSWAKDDQAIENLMRLDIIVGSEKYQTKGGTKVNIGEWYQQKRIEAMGKRGSISEEELPWLPVEKPSPKGAISLVGKSVTFAGGSAIPSGYWRTKPSPSSGYWKSPISQIPLASSPKSISPPSSSRVSPSFSPSSISRIPSSSLSPSRSPRSPSPMSPRSLSRLPSSSSSRPPLPSLSPISTTYPRPPISSPPISRPPSTPRTPPSTPPPSTPNRPRTPPETPPPDIPGMGGMLGGGGGARQYGNLGVIQWRRINLVADMPYLSRGMRAADWDMGIYKGDFVQGKSRKKSKRRKK